MKHKRLWRIASSWMELQKQVFGNFMCCRATDSSDIAEFSKIKWFIDSIGIVSNSICLDNNWSPSVGSLASSTEAPGRMGPLWINLFLLLLYDLFINKYEVTSHWAMVNSFSFACGWVVLANKGEDAEGTYWPADPRCSNFFLFERVDCNPMLSKDTADVIEQD